MLRPFVSGFLMQSKWLNKEKKLRTIKITTAVTMAPENLVISLSIIISFFRVCIDDLILSFGCNDDLSAQYSQDRRSTVRPIPDVVWNKKEVHMCASVCTNVYTCVYEISLVSALLPWLQSPPRCLWVQSSFPWPTLCPTFLGTFDFDTSWIIQLLATG